MVIHKLRGIWNYQLCISGITDFVKLLQGTGASPRASRVGADYIRLDERQRPVHARTRHRITDN